MTIAYVAIGSNLFSPLLQVESAIAELDKLPKSYVLEVSSYYRTSPLGSEKQPDYLNAAVALETSLDAHALLDSIQQIELKQGRTRKKNDRWGPRIIDLDLMLFGDEIINTIRLTIPHYDMHNRGFMLWPLVEIAPTLFFPNGETLYVALSHLGEKKPPLW